MDGAAETATLTPGAPMEERRKNGGGFLFRLRPAEFIAVIGLVSGGILWLASVSSTAGGLANRLERVESDTAAMRTTLDSVRESVTDLRVGIEARGSDLRERLARIEGLLAPSAVTAPTQGPR